MQKLFILSLMLVAAALALPANAEVFPVQTVSELIENAKVLDGNEVTITTEMIGDVMKRGDHAWINGLDSTGVMGLWVPAPLASEVKILGNGKYKGDTFRITGIFHRACQEHGGDMDIHVNGLDLTAPGYASDQSISRTKLLYAAVLSLLGIVFAGVYYKKRFV